MAEALGGASRSGGRTQQRPGGAGSGRPAPPRALLPHKVRCCLRSVGRAQRVGLWVSCKVVLAEAVSSALRIRGQVAVRECGSLPRRGPVLRHAGQRAVLRVPVVEEKEAGERRLWLARQQLSQQADQLRVALLLGGPPRHAGNLEGVRVVAQHQQLVAAAKRHAGGHVEVPVAAGVVGLVLLLVNLQQDVAPRGRQSKVCVGGRSLRLQPTAAEGQVVLVLKGDQRVAECLVHLKLLTPGHCARVVAVHRLRVSQQAQRSGEWEVLPCRRSRGTVAVVAHARRSPRRRSRGTDG